MQVILYYNERNFKEKLASAIVKRERVDYGEHQIARIDPNKDVDAMLEIVDEKNVSTSAMIKGLEEIYDRLADK